VRDHYNPIIELITGMPKPVIAAINGMAAGAGASFAYACDLRVAAASAKFLMAFANVGLTADSAASWTLPRLIGYGRAMEMMMLAEPVTAARALEIGMVTRVVDDELVLRSAQELATRMAAGPTVAYGVIKKALLVAGGSDLATAVANEDVGQSALGSTSDHREAVDAFVAKRKPTFSGH
jgi:2-(1,2-epoxy-1,2-dihydrophenyl)acetyl-CoA isomerase